MIRNPEPLISAICHALRGHLPQSFGQDSQSSPSSVSHLLSPHSEIQWWTYDLIERLKFFE